jgi:hypothetical protein
MKFYSLSPVTFLIIPIVLSWTSYNEQWNPENHDGFRIFYTAADEQNKGEYAGFVENGMKTVTGFFGSPFPEEFDVYIHPNRQSLDSTWQHDWKMPDFKSQCWMVASGVADRLDMISPKNWASQACEHVYSNTVKTKQLITHELVHVFHGQHNPSPDFSSVSGIDWFVEGLATYASGQLDEARIAEVKKVIAEGKGPSSLDQFWSGRLKYGLSGSMVMFIDHKFGREKLISLLKFTHVDELLKAIDASETELLEGWESYINSL